jgi:hypothetical protein
LASGIALAGTARRVVERRSSEGNMTACIATDSIAEKHLFFARQSRGVDLKRQMRDARALSLKNVH